MKAHEINAAALGVEFVPLAGGTFRMGSEVDDPEATDFEKPAHAVTVPAFELAKTPVTLGQYQAAYVTYKALSLLEKAVEAWKQASDNPKTLATRAKAAAKQAQAALELPIPEIAQTAARLVIKAGNNAQPVSSEITEALAEASKALRPLAFTLPTAACAYWPNEPKMPGEPSLPKFYDPEKLTALTPAELERNVEKAKTLFKLPPDLKRPEKDAKPISPYALEVPDDASRIESQIAERAQRLKEWQTDAEDWRQRLESRWPSLVEREQTRIRALLERWSAEESPWKQTHWPSILEQEPLRIESALNRWKRDWDEWKPKYIAWFEAWSAWRRSWIEMQFVPVTGISWHEASRFAQFLGARLPTESEWEFAARGPESRRYPWGNEAPDAKRANFGLVPLAPVDAHPQGETPEGLKDMAGNVWEWVEDRRADHYSGHPSDGRPFTASQTSFRVCKGGSIGFTDVRAANRSFNFASDRSPALGFRLARDPG